MSKRHPNKEIHSAIEYALDNGWRLDVGGSHRWGVLYCPLATRAGHIVNIYSTPRSPFYHARSIRRQVDNCEHEESSE